MKLATNTFSSDLLGFSEIDNGIVDVAALRATKQLLWDSGRGDSADSDKIEPTSAVDGERLRKQVVFCTALAYMELANVNLQVQILKQQEIDSEKLLEIEALRVIEEVDNPVAHSRAKLLAAKTRLLAAELSTSENLLRDTLANLTGLSSSEIEPIPESIPALPYPTTLPRKWDGATAELAAMRDVAQLEYALARTNRMEQRVKTIVASANPGDLVSAYISEQEKFDSMLEAQFLWERGQIELLWAADNLECWISGKLNIKSEPKRAILAESRGKLGTSRNKSESRLKPVAPFPRSLMITPAVTAMVVGECRQLSAIVIQTDGSGRDASAETVWTASSSSNAIVSTTGLVTAIRPGDVLVYADVFDFSESRSINITVDASSPFNP